MASATQKCPKCGDVFQAGAIPKAIHNATKHKGGK
jgi:hypothetical protein